MTLRFPIRGRAAVACGVAALAVCASATTASTATAAHDIQFGLTDDAWLLNGPGTLDSRLQQLSNLGVQVVRFTLNWNQIARTPPADPTDPTDPAYNWTTEDPVLDGLRTHGIDVVLQLLGSADGALILGSLVDAARLSAAALV